jgi:hypothetical protein
LYPQNGQTYHQPFGYNDYPLGFETTTQQNVLSKQFLNQIQKNVSTSLSPTSPIEHHHHHHSAYLVEQKLHKNQLGKLTTKIENEYRKNEIESNDSTLVNLTNTQPVSQAY